MTQRFVVAALVEIGQNRLISKPLELLLHNQPLADFVVIPEAEAGIQNSLIVPRTGFPMTAPGMTKPSCCQRLIKQSELHGVLLGSVLLDTKLYLEMP